MKLAEALLERANLKKTIAQTLGRAKDNLKVQEGDEPFDDPEKLLEEYERLESRLTKLIRDINRTNARTIFDGSETLADVLARRDGLKERIAAYTKVYETLQIVPDRFTRTEVRFVRCMDPKKVQKKIDGLSKEFRELDMRLQEFNWTVELAEDN